MFSVSDIKEWAFPAVFRRGKELYEAGAVLDFSYEVYLDGEMPVAEITAEVRGSGEDVYQVQAVVDEKFADVASVRCGCESYYECGGKCKHGAAVLFAYVSRRQAQEILRLREARDDAEEKAAGKQEEWPVMTTQSALKSILNRYSLRAGSACLIPEGIYGRVELEPYLKLEHSFPTVEFKIGVEQKYVLKNISAFLRALQTNEKIRYGKKLDFYHNTDAFSEQGRRMIGFLERQDRDKKRQSQYHTYYAYSSSYERTMELDEVGIDRFFDVIRAGGEGYGFLGEMHYEPERFFRMEAEERRPKLTIRGGGAGAFLILEDLHILRGGRYYYFYEGDRIWRSTAMLRGCMADFFDYLERQTGGECYIANAELPMFCRDLLPLVRESFEVVCEGFDESLYVPKKPEFELFLDKQSNNVIGAKLMAVYDRGKYNVLEAVEPGEVRDLTEEMRMRSLVEPYFNEYGMGQTVFVLSHNEDMLYRLLANGLHRLSEYMTIYTSKAFCNMKVVQSPVVSVGVALKSDLLELSIHSEEMADEEIAYLLTKYDRRKKYIRLKNGDFLDIREDGLGLLAEVSEDLRLTEDELKKTHTYVPKYRAMYLDAALKNNSVLFVEKNREFKGMVRNMKTIEDSDYEVPAALKQVMRSYQKNGFLWLKTLRENGFGGILADDMGLGKTLQVISLLLSEQQDVEAGLKPRRRSLVVCPASLVYNWQKEIGRFAPELSVALIVGSAAERARRIQETTEGQILITSYDLLKRDADEYQNLMFAIQVIDEAQYVKNPGTQAAKGVKKIPAVFRLALTGTPIENRLGELWSIFDYLMPGFLYSYQRFREEIELPIISNSDANKMERLQRMIRPFVLRRLKGDVLKDLPEKLEEPVFARMTGEQAAIYDAHALRMRRRLEETTEKEFGVERIQILAELTKLRQICCDPALLFADYGGESAKTEVCLDLIRKAVDGGHKILLFSQFTTMLERLAERLTSAGIAYYMLTGAVGKEKRMQMVEQFHRDPVPVFCISLKAGGTGLNLTAADIVIHYDPWWNVAVQDQATDRAHRIGQKHVVTVYKLVSEGTIEEKMIQIQERKRLLAEQIMEGEGMGTASFTREELLELLGR